MASLEHKHVKKSTQKDSPVACPLAGTGREATHNSRWYMRNRATITHSISRGLMAIALHFILSICSCRLLPNRQSYCNIIQREKQSRKRRQIPAHSFMYLRLASSPRNAREFGKLTHRRPIGMVASESPHDYCFGVASRLLLRSRLTTPHPFGAKAMLLAKLTYSRRQFSPLRGKS